MPGKPITRAAGERMAAYGLDRILARVTECETLKRIANDPAINVSRPMLNRWLLGIDYDKQVPGSETGAQQRATFYREAQRLSAMVRAEREGGAGSEGQDFRMAQLADARVEFSLRLSQVLERFPVGHQSPSQEPDLGELHLESLRRRALAHGPQRTVTSPSGQAFSAGAA